MSKIKIKIKKIIPERFHEKIYKTLVAPFETHGSVFYSQEGEDAILARFFGCAYQGFFVDIGAFHPKKFSNTYYFYKKGWHGINIDAMPGSMKAFKKVRPRDINIEQAISDKPQKLTYYAFSAPALNGFSAQLSSYRTEKENCQLLFKKEIETSTLAAILDNNLPKGQKIDFMSIDVENLDLQVLKSNDWKKYVPNYILVETFGKNWKSVTTGGVYKFLHDKNYEIVAKTRNTALFKYKNSRK